MDITSSTLLVEVFKQKPNLRASKTLCCSKKWFSLLWINFPMILAMLDKKEIGL